MMIGFHKNMPFDEYLKVEAFSNSFAKRFAITPAHSQVPWKPKDPKVVDIGNAFHTASLEPELYDSRFTVTDLKLSTTEGKQFKKQATADKKIIIKQKDHENIQAMAQAVKDHPDAGPLVKGGVTEISFFWKDPEYGFLCKGRSDKITDSKVVVDLKKTQDAEDQSRGFGAFFKSFFSLKYHWQAYHYLNGISIASGVPHDTFAFIAVEEQPPHGINVFIPDKELLAWAMEEIEPLKEKYAECLETGKWPCYETGIKTIELPKWVKGRYDDV